ncbi:MAG: hypothetical protein ACE15C_04620 [Phycisphaerae bacterium]
MDLTPQERAFSEKWLAGLERSANLSPAWNWALLVLSISCLGVAVYGFVNGGLAVTNWLHTEEVPPVMAATVPAHEKPVTQEYVRLVIQKAASEQKIRAVNMMTAIITAGLSFTIALPMLFLSASMLHLAISDRWIKKRNSVLARILRQAISGQN